MATEDTILICEWCHGSVATSTVIGVTS